MPNLPPQAAVLLRSEETTGQVSITEIVVPAHTTGPPLHAHNFDEAFYLLEGELIFQVDDALETERPGELASPPATSPTRWPTTTAHPRATCWSARRRASNATGPHRRRGRRDRATPVGAATHPRRHRLGPPIAAYP